MEATWLRVWRQDVKGMFPAAKSQNVVFLLQIHTHEYEWFSSSVLIMRQSLALQSPQKVLHLEAARAQRTTEYLERGGMAGCLTGSR